MFDFHTHFTEKCPDLISRIKNIRTLGINVSKESNSVRVEDLLSRVAKALLANQTIESLQLKCYYGECEVLADKLIVAERLILTDLHLMSVLFPSGFQILV